MPANGVETTACPAILAGSGSCSGAKHGHAAVTRDALAAASQCGPMCHNHMPVLLSDVLQPSGLHLLCRPDGCYHEHALPLRQAASGWGAGCAMSRPSSAAYCCVCRAGVWVYCLHPAMLQTVPLSLEQRARLLQRGRLCTAWR